MVNKLTGRFGNLDVACKLDWLFARCSGCLQVGLVVGSLGTRVKVVMGEGDGGNGKVVMGRRCVPNLRIQILWLHKL